MKRLFFLVLVVSLMFGGLAWAADEKPKPAGLMLPEGVTKYGDTLYVHVSTMNFQDTRLMFLSLAEWNWKKIVIDLYTGGGSLFDALGMAALIKEQQEAGKTVEIRCRGLVASAGILVLLSGSPDHRFIDRHAMLMFHEFWGIKIAIVTPTSTEEEAKIFRKIQDKVNEFIAEHSKMPKEDLDARIRNKEFWMDADEALKYGFADKIWGEKPKAK